MLCWIQERLNEIEQVSFSLIKVMSSNSVLDMQQRLSSIWVSQCSRN